MQKAESLNDIIELKNNMQLTHETVMMHYVKPPGKVHEKIHGFFQINHLHPQKMLFIGPKGAGKRTLLRYMSKHMFNRYHCLTINLFNRLNPVDISQVDIIFCLLNHLIENLSHIQKRFDPGVLNSIYQNLHDEQFISLIHFKKSEAGDAEGTKIGFIKSFIDAIVEAIATSGNETRNHIRKSFEPRLRLLLKSVQELIDYINQICQRNGRSLMIIFDDLGQYDLSTTELFFQNHFPLTARLQVNIIYTMPDCVRFSPFFHTIYDTMDRIEYLRMIPVVNHDQTPFIPGKNYISDIIRKRIDFQLIPETILESIIMTSGGVVNDSFQLLIETAICSLLDHSKSEDIDIQTFEQIKQQFVRQKIQQLNYQQFCILKDLDLSNPSWTGNKDIQSLMMKNVLIEYESDQHIWFDIHPLIKEYFKTGCI
jgi:GTPase SAR1 family protein